MRIRIIFRPDPPFPKDTFLFNDVFVPRQSKGFPLFASAVVHALALASIPALVQALSTYDPPPEHKTYHLEMMHLRLPDRVYLPPAKVHPVESAKAASPGPASVSERSHSAAGAGAAPSLSTSSGQLGLPVARHVSDHAPVILQPDAPVSPNAVVPAAPDLAFWNQAPPPQPRRLAVIPGRVQQSSLPPSLNAPPALSPPNPQPATSDVAAVLAPTQTAPKLPLANSSTNPIRIQGKGGTEIASFEMSRSDPVNLIYLMADKPAPKQVEIPKGLQNAPQGRGGTEGSHAASGATPERATAPASATTARLASNAQPVANGSGSDRSPDREGGSASNPTLSGRPTTVAPTGAVSAASHTPDPVTGNSAGVIRVAHPANGNFDVVILQSGSRDDLPEVGAALSGNPVYTVYLNVGDKREWLLEYCIPSSVTFRASAYQVNIDDPGVVAAPYPVSTAIPARVVELQRSKHIALHGVLSPTGIFHNVTSPDMEDPLVREVLPLLGQWKFRPALRDQVPVEVEILLIIPARS